MKNFIPLFSFSLILFLAFSCNGKDDPVPVKKDITLSETELLFEKQDESVKTVTVNTEEPFQLDKQPGWLILDIDQSKKTIEMSVNPNYTRQAREVLLKVFDGDSESYLKITQLGEEEEKEPFSFSYFPGSGVSSYTTSDVDGSTTYHFKADRSFINQQIKEEVYLGNIINYKLTSLYNLQTFKDYTVNDIVAFAYPGINGSIFDEEWETPSKSKMDNLAQRVIDAKPNQNLSFSSGSPKIFRSYKYLHFLSMANLGFGLDTFLHEGASPDKTMKKDVGLIYSYNQTLFTITMDLPNGAREKTDFITANNLSFIHGVDYGIRAFLIVESDGSEDAAKSLIAKGGRGENLSESEMSLINSMDINYLYFSPDGTLQKDTSADNIEKITNYVGAKNSNIIPLTFSVLDYVNSGMTEIEYTITLRREKLLADAGIIHNKLKINAAIENAKTILTLQKEYGSFEKWLDHHHPKTKKEWVKLFKKHSSLLEAKLSTNFY